MQSEICNNFKNEFYKNFHEYVLPTLAPIEETRLKYINISQKITKIFFISGFITIILSIITFFISKTDFTGFLAVILFIYFLSLFIYFFIKKIYELILNYQIKQKIIPLILHCIPDFSWDINNPLISKEEILNAKLLPDIENAYLITDDNFSGVYKNVNIKMSECFLKTENEKNTQTKFMGPVIRIDMNKTFEGRTIIRPKRTKNLVNELEEVHLEDIEIGKTYNIYSSDQIEARYIITPTFIERFLDIKTKFNAERIYCSIYDKYIYIGLYCSKNLFEISSLSNTLTDKSQYENLINEFASILALVDHFKLDKKLGL